MNYNDLEYSPFRTYRIEAEKFVLDKAITLYENSKQDSEMLEILNNFFQDASFRNEIVKSILVDLDSEPEPYTISEDGELRLAPSAHLYEYNYEAGIRSYGKSILESKKQSSRRV